MDPASRFGNAKIAELQETDSVRTSFRQLAIRGSQGAEEGMFLLCLGLQDSTVRLMDILMEEKSTIIYHCTPLSCSFCAMIWILKMQMMQVAQCEASVMLHQSSDRAAVLAERRRVVTWMRGDHQVALSRSNPACGVWKHRCRHLSIYHSIHQIPSLHTQPLAQPAHPNQCPPEGRWAGARAVPTPRNLRRAGRRRPTSPSHVDDDSGEGFFHPYLGTAAFLHLGMWPIETCSGAWS